MEDTLALERALELGDRDPLGLGDTVLLEDGEPVDAALEQALADTVWDTETEEVGDAAPVAPLLKVAVGDALP